mgnify:CR=1 FL=1
MLDRDNRDCSLAIYGIFRYQLLSDPEEIARQSDTELERGGRSERPEEILLTDKPIAILVEL